MDTSEKQESPEFVQTSLAGAMALGLEPGSFYRNAYPGSLNLLMTYQSGCRANCSYCGLARERKAKPDENTFIRVKWPMYQVTDIIDILARPRQEIAMKVQRLGRICISMITHPQAPGDCVSLVRRFSGAISMPISVLVSPTVLPDAGAFFQELRAAGADCVGVAIDAATPELFAAMRGPAVAGPHRWETYWAAVKEAVRVFGRDHVSVHLIVGLGETEQDMVKTIGQVSDAGAQVHLFSFCPEPGSFLSNHKPPSYGQYRRIQLAAYLFNNNQITQSAFQFDSKGKIVSFGQPLEELLGADLAQGNPFMTSGCPNREGCVACNRPYGNERPGPNLRNYPFLPEEHDMNTIKGQIWND
ncbi:Radical SAM superfamily protein [Sporomusa ovata DSM 2662]|uniref:Biotin synthase-related protein, radical SAM superfamily n=1 Tax=Sporomusa ovata TaxID=2378 RepID=A0A0U1L1R9_9FIRM|nr:radical SAM protein [Sporomusa ovata]EQB24543.1 radical SAM domain-containing protein [Sporomusa ovata DSM 2662]CQR73485.1 Biotin synthase-related protein, radical SAM superfamily [Sporomusa ovata]